MEIADLDLVVIPRRTQISASHLGDGQQNAVIVFEILITETGLPAVIDTRYLHPDKVTGVVDHAHLVGFGIADADAANRGRHSLLHHGSVVAGKSAPS